MAELKELASIIQINGEDYAVTAEKAEKVKHSLTIKTGNDTKVFDGSEDITIEAGSSDGGNAESAKTIQVKLDDNKTADATITISKNDPSLTAGNVGDIWFRYTVKDPE